MQPQILPPSTMMTIQVVILTVLAAVNGAEPPGEKTGSIDLFGTTVDMCNSIKASTPVLVQAVFRHGDRSAVHTYPKDPNVHEWPQGLGQLSTTGMRQAYNLGQFLRHCYGDLIGTTYHHQEVTIRSTDVDRTLMTAQCVAAGLFPLDEQNAEESFLTSWPLGSWQPIPIHTEQINKDTLMKTTYSCDYVQKLSAGVGAKQAMKIGLINNKELMINLTRFTGMNINISSLHGLADTVFCQHVHNMTRPPWLTEEMEQTLIGYHKNVPAINREVAKFISGPLLLKLFSNMVEKAKQSKNPYKLRLYSGHDSTLHPLMSLLGIHNDIQVPYTGALLMELYIVSGQPFVRMLFRNDSASPPHVLYPIGCDKELCGLYDLVHTFKHYILTKEEWDTVCDEKVIESNKSLDVKKNAVPIMVGVLVVFIGIIGVLAYKTHTYRQEIRKGPKADEYALLKTDVEGTSESEAEIYSMDETLSARPQRTATRSPQKSEDEYDDVCDDVDKK